jgi:hypothetical protein
MFVGIVFANNLTSNNITCGPITSIHLYTVQSYTRQLYILTNQSIALGVCYVFEISIFGSFIADWSVDNMTPGLTLYGTSLDISVYLCKELINILF